LKYVEICQRDSTKLSQIEELSDSVVNEAGAVACVIEDSNDVSGSEMSFTTEHEMLPFNDVKQKKL